MRLVLTNTSPGISRLAPQMHAQSSHLLAYVLFVLYKNVNVANLKCEMIVFLILLIVI